jgi:hypothetical protein
MLMLQTNSYIMHYGIPGQKWGVRRYQNEDGTLTEEGMRKYGIGERLHGQFNPSEKIRQSYNNWQIRNHSAIQKINKEKQSGKQPSKHRLELIDKYRKQGLTQQQAEVAALRRERTENVVKAAGIIALTAAAAYGIHKGRQWMSTNLDKKIKAGTELYRVTGDNTSQLKSHAGYVATNATDADKYIGKYGSEIQQKKFTEHLQQKGNSANLDVSPYQIKGKASSNIRLAGDRKANKVYQNLLKTDKEFAKDNETIRKYWEDQKVNRGITNSYKDFNVRLTDRNLPESDRVQKKFYDALKSKGYGGLIDVNDRDFSGYHSKNAAILFNLKDSISQTTIRKISNDEVSKKLTAANQFIRNQYIQDAKISNVFKKVGKFGLYASGGTGLLSIMKSRNDRKDRFRGTYQRTLIKQYKKEHPNTKLSDEKILENLLKE